MDATVKFLTTLAGIVEGITLDQALRIMEVSEDRLRSTVHPLTTHEGRVQLARETDAVTDALKNGKKIQAIKELRTLLSAKTGTIAGLRECKDAVDALATEFPTNRRYCCGVPVSDQHSYSCYNSPGF